eukprot:scaffold107_cov215-Alexandrium_tamarense.AAC.26
MVDKCTTKCIGGEQSVEWMGRWWWKWLASLLVKKVWCLDTKFTGIHIRRRQISRRLFIPCQFTKCCLKSSWLPVKARFSGGATLDASNDVHEEYDDDEHEDNGSCYVLPRWYQVARSSAGRDLCRLPVSYCDYDAFAESMSGLQLFRSALLVSVLFGGERT